MENPAELSRLIRQSLVLDLPYEDRAMRPRPPGFVPRGGDPTPAATLAVFSYPGPALLLTRRTDHVETHKGQIAFPGGMVEPGEGHEAAALRETEEEMGLPRAHVQIVGKLPILRTITSFEVTPFVGFFSERWDEFALKPNAQEIDDFQWVPLNEILAPDAYRREAIEHQSIRYPIDVFELRGYRVWGATGTMLKNLVDRIKKAGLVLAVGALIGFGSLQAQAADPWKVTPPESNWAIAAMGGLGLPGSSTGLAASLAMSRKIWAGGWIADISNDVHGELQAGWVFLFGAPANYTLFAIPAALVLRWDFHLNEQFTFFALGGAGFTLTYWAGVNGYAFYPKLAIGVLWRFAKHFALRGEISHEQTVVGIHWSI